MPKTEVGRSSHEETGKRKQKEVSGEYRCEGTVLAAFEDGTYKYAVP